MAETMALAGTVESEVTANSAGLPAYAKMKDSGVEWLGRVPAHWSVERLKRSLLNVVEPTGERPKLGAVIALENVESGTGRVTHVDPETPFDSQLKRFRAGDVLFGKLRPYLAKVARRPTGGLCVGEFFVLRPRRETVEGAYFEHLLRSKPLINAVAASTFGARMPRANWQFMGAMQVVRPPLPEQTAIVRYLDQIGRRIRRTIRSKERLVELLAEQKQGAIEQAVTGGIDVRTGRPYPAYKSSGVEWLERVPAHWEMRRSKHVFRPRKELARPGDVQLSATQAYGVIAQAEYEAKIGRKVTKITRNLQQRRHVEVDDFVISMRSFQGGLERAWRSGCTRSSYIVLQAVTPLEVGYFGHLFKSRCYIAALQSTANFIRDGQDLNFENFAGVDLPFPPPEEQREIAEAMGREADWVSARTQVSRHQIALLREYRERLTADVVTGKVDARGAAADLPEFGALDTGRHDLTAGEAPGPS